MQLQINICLDMLTFRWFGANFCEVMMLGKPVICYSSPDWIDAIREEIPDYVHELPVISTSPNTVDRELRNRLFI